MKRFEPKDIGLDKDFTDDTPIHGQLDIEQLLFRQIERTNQAAVQDETLFAANVRILLSMIPTNKREEVHARHDEYTSTQQRWEHKYCCGVPMGTPEEPVNGSPALIEEEVIDWHMLHQCIMEALEMSNLTWKRESWTVDAQRAEETESKPQPHPLLFDEPVQETPIQIPSAEPVKKIKNRSVCKVCEHPIEPGDGIYFKGHHIHNKCMDGAKVKWID